MDYQIVKEKGVISLNQFMLLTQDNEWLCGTLMPTNAATIETYYITCNEAYVLCGDQIILRQSEGDGTSPNDGVGYHCIHVSEIEIYGTWGQGKFRDYKPGTWI